MEFTRAAQVVAGILFHSSIMTSRSCWMLDTWCFSTFRLRMPHMCSIGFRSGDILGHSITFTFSSKAVSSWLCVWGGYVGKQFLKGGHHLLLHNVTVHVGIHVSLNEPQLPSTSHPAPNHDATTTMLDCRQGTNFLILLTRASPHMLDTIWVKQVYLRLIRPQDMVPVIHALDQVVFSKLFAGFFVSQLQKRLPSGMTAMQTDLLQCVAYGLSTDKLTFHFCNCSEQGRGNRGCWGCCSTPCFFLYPCLLLPPRSFSALRRLKTWLRKSVTQKRLTHMALLHVHREILDCVNVQDLVREKLHVWSSKVFIRLNADCYFAYMTLCAC